MPIEPLLLDMGFGVSSIEGATDEQLLQLHEMAVLVTRQSATLSAMGGGYQIPAVEMLDLLIAVEVEMVERDITEPLQLLCAVYSRAWTDVLSSRAWLLSRSLACSSGARLRRQV